MIMEQRWERMHKKIHSGILLTLLLTGMVVLAFNIQYAIASVGFIDSGQNLGDSYTRSVILGDIDEDGDLDLVAGNSHGQPDKVFLNDGSGIFSDSGQNLGSSGTYGVSVGDVDNDEDLDLIVANYAYPNQVYLNDGQGVFVDSGQLLGGSSYSTFSIALGDIDEDGDLDFVAGNTGGGGAGHENKVYVNNGAGIFVDSGQSLGSSSTKSIALADIDSDSDLDLVEGNDNYQANKVYLNDGTGTFADSGQNLGTSMTESIALGDLDSDGDLDLVAGNAEYGLNANKIYINQCMSPFPVIYIRPDGSIDPPTAPIRRDGDLYILTDNITSDGIVIERNNMTLDGATYMVRGSGSGVGFLLSGINNVTIRNADVRDFGYGIYISSSSFNMVLGNDITENDWDGIGIYGPSNNNTISGNNIAGNDWNGVWLYGQSSNNNTISGNNMTRNSRDGILISRSSDNDILTNNITENGGDGIELYESSNNNISRNHIANNTYGHGIKAIRSSDNNDISGNNISNNREGIAVTGSSDTVSGNNIMANNQDGMCFYGSHSSIFGNNVSNNANGIHLYGASNNNISNNHVANHNYGILTTHSSTDNLICHNNFVNNSYQAYSYATTNFWDDGYPSGGNYWSNYEERYPEAQELDGSGIWDTPYVIDENNQDNYPLMEPWAPAPPIPTTIDELKTEIEELGVDGEIDNQGIVTSLLAKLDAAQKLIDDGKTDQAKSLLNAFINEVHAQSGKHITPEAAELLIESAEHILSNL